MTDHKITTDAQLDAIYGAPIVASKTKELDHISDYYAKFIEKAPFVALATIGTEGMDCSPRGDPAGFVRIVDSKTVMIPDRRGNGRIDTLRNIVADGRIALLFLIPGVGETMRINGRAELTTDPEICESFTMQGKVPQSVIIVHAEAVYFQCSKALVRSKLWDPEMQIARTELPSTGEMIEAFTDGEVDGKAYDDAYPQRLKDTIY